MKKTIIIIALLGLVARPQITVAQTSYTGIADVHCAQYSFPVSCGTNQFSGKMADIRYTVFYQSGLPDSIIYEVLNSCSNSQLQFMGSPSKITYLKNDADSIVFNVGFHFFNADHGCKQFEDYTGIARISKATADIVTKENVALNLQLFPNPTTGLLKIKANADNAIVIDCLGRVVISQKFEMNDNIEFSTLDVSSLPSGCYTLVLSEGIKKITAKFIKY